MPDFLLEPRGPFDLAAAARFVAGWPPAARPGQAGRDSVVEDGRVLRLGFLVDDWSGHAGVVLRQEVEHGPVAGTIVDSTAADPSRIRDQAARIISLDHDGEGYAAVGQRDPVVAQRQRDSGWLRPVLFHSPYEAACWAILSGRIRQAQAARIRDDLGAAHGARLDVEGEPFVGFPAPERLVAVAEVPGLSAEKVARLHGIARAALDGRLDPEPLLALDPDRATAALGELRGIGPFWAMGILLRAVGTTDALPLGEGRVRAIAASAYAAPDLVEDDDAFIALAERWRPFRTWVSVLLRATG